MHTDPKSLSQDAPRESNVASMTLGSEIQPLQGGRQV